MIFFYRREESSVDKGDLMFCKWMSCHAGVDKKVTVIYLDLVTGSNNTILLHTMSGIALPSIATVGYTMQYPILPFPFMYTTSDLLPSPTHYFSSTTIERAPLPPPIPNDGFSLVT